MASSSVPLLTNNQEVRIVMVGKTGIGKSATGNTILGDDYFESECSPESLTVDCAKHSAVVDGQQITVIDTPGLSDTRFDEDKTIKDLSQCIAFSSPGPHIFLVIIALNRFTTEEKQTVQKIQEIFGEAANKFSMVLFTHGDSLKKKNIEQYLSQSSALQELVRRCNGQYQVFNNTLENKKPQVTQLLQKINNIVQLNGGSHYTSEMFQEAERAIEEAKQQILKEKEEEMRREKEELEREINKKYEDMQKLNDKLQAERERERLREIEAEKKRLQAEHEALARRQAEAAYRPRCRCVIL